MYSHGWNFNGNATNESVLKPLCQQVEQEIALTNCLLQRHFAVKDHSCFGEIGPYFRGCHVSSDSREHLDSDLWHEMDGADTLIYIRHSTCLDPTGCVITYAHELQHVVQHGLYPKLLHVNSVLRRYLDPVPPSEMDLPTERDANIVSKRVAEVVCGMEAVRTFANEQVKLMEANIARAQKFRRKEDETRASRQKVKWELFLITPPSTAYDPLPATLELVEQHKATINFGMDVCKPEWWLGPWPETNEG